jgi:SOS response regulatory protein OraA/RecX
MKKWKTPLELGIWYLGKYAKTEKEVKEYFNRRKEDCGFIWADVVAAILKLKNAGYINDRAIAESMIYSLRGRYGKKMIKQKMIMRGIDSAIIDELFENFEEEILDKESDESFEEGAILKLTKKFIVKKPITFEKYCEFNDIDEDSLEDNERFEIKQEVNKNKQKLFAHLAGKGFNFGEISKVTDEIIKNS